MPQIKSRKTMKTKDRLKEEISFYKLIMTISSAIFSSLVGWLFNNITTEISMVRLIMVIVTMVVSFIITSLSLVKIRTEIKELDL
ncbi:MAG: hypothetical protein A2887_04775 [Alphaproteobacteria bacterium RIFCSPLOWO2_01_FULL_40_26]|nr:MAG: hypothetical protein A2887_04775 [Alphaproteobacteria bacterium RIFCSPLOWO2_01_FULL_40_26]